MTATTKSDTDGLDDNEYSGNDINTINNYEDNNIDDEKDIVDF